MFHPTCQSALSCTVALPHSTSPIAHQLHHDLSPETLGSDRTRNLFQLTPQIESFLQLYTHLVPPNDLQPVTDILVFQARISKPGIWEVMPE